MSFTMLANDISDLLYFSCFIPLCVESDELSMPDGLKDIKITDVCSLKNVDYEDNMDSILKKTADILGRR